MTLSLKEAIAEVQQYPNLALRPKAIQLVLTAVASGDLIPSAGLFSSAKTYTEAEVKLAVALAYQQALEICASQNRRGRDEYDAGWDRCADTIADGITALADADALAEVQVLREQVARTDERAARICEALLRKGVSPEKWPDYFRNRAAGDQIVVRAALSAYEGENG